MDTSVIVRRAERGDAPEIRRLALEVQAIHVAGRPDIFKPDGGETVDEIADRIVAPGERYWVGVVQDAIVAYAYARVLDEPDNRWKYAVRTLLLDQMGVDARYRSRGIGKQLWRAVRDGAIADGAARIILSVWSFNTDARRFYERLGFEAFHERMVVELTDARHQGP